MRALFPILTILFLLSCAQDPTTGPGTNRPDTTAVTVTIDLQAYVGDRPLRFGERHRAPNGVDYEVTLLRYYLSSLYLVDTSGAEVPLQLVDTSGAPLRYNLMLYDLDVPSSYVARFTLRPGVYRELRCAIGVPLFGPNGDSLNHTDASVNEHPLNVDADMYWGWKPGYIHFKLEGKSRVDTADALFYYHVGEDRRLMYVQLASPMAISSTSGRTMTMRLDVNKVFVTPSGEFSPNPGGSLYDRVANSGAIADTVANNVSRGGVFTLIP